MTSIELPHGVVSFRVAGPADTAAPPVLFVHPFLIDGTLWSGVADLLATQGIRSYAPDWPLGAHRTPVRPGTDQSPRGVARQILRFIEALDLRDVTLVGGDTGGALCQFLLDTDPSRIGRVVLTNCDAFDVFPPFPFNVMFFLLKGETRMKINMQPMRWRAFRHSPLGLGLLANELDPAQTRSWIEPSLTDGAIRKDAVEFLKAAEPKDLLDVSTRLSRFTGPVTIVWGTADRAFTPKLGRRLQHAFRNARFVEVPEARTLVPLDAPQQLADAIAASTAPQPRPGASAP
ncbi:alpha/beta fold hydrolase [Pseudonocardia sp. MH-G8]|uniref:alpha/beta fold hydrolase n=1 Tax=Pseudonocardia sp. MH-G8 TaxID=1854588 RepID=UPI000BA06F50|nr:alpha/beta fold hydrolase [Pseudonocardia sp. MH-G8]OZM82124.1 alpha/beta hydrolase [Pseudonocardia sp. MH-G8]